MPRKYRILDNGQDGPISSTTEREYPTAQELAAARTKKARFKPIKADSFIRQATSMRPEVGYKTNRTKTTRKIGPLTFDKYGTYKGSGSKGKGSYKIPRGKAPGSKGVGSKKK